MTKKILVGLALTAVTQLLGCHYEPSICDESPGSGCAECDAVCAQDHRAGTADLEACEARCRKGKWKVGLSSCGS